MSTTTKLGAVLSFAAVIGATAVGVPALAPADNGCPNDLVPRLANPYDPVCVTKQVAAEIAQENANGANLRDPNGAFGPNTCKPGYVWREAFEGDAVCVVPDRRQETWKQNAAANIGPTGGIPMATRRAPIATLPTSPKGPEPTSDKPTGPLQTSFKPTPTGTPVTPAAPPPQNPAPSAPPHPGGTTVPPATPKATTTPLPTPQVTTPPTTAKPACNPKVDICVH